MASSRPGIFKSPATSLLKIGSGIQGYTGGGGGEGDPGVAVFQVQRRHSYGMFPVKLFGNMPSSSNASPHGSNQQ